MSDKHVQAGDVHVDYKELWETPDGKHEAQICRAWDSRLGMVFQVSWRDGLYLCVTLEAAIEYLESKGFEYLGQVE